MLVITQTVDIHNPALGFFHNWITRLAKYYESLIVVCLYEGEHNLPSNVLVLSLGKESGATRFVYITRFFKYIWKYRNSYRNVFVHMNQEYVLLGGLLWRMWGKHIAFWYNHTSGTLFTDIAMVFVHNIFHTSPYAYTSRSKKSVRMPAGIDTDLFTKVSDVQKKLNSVLYVGRLSPIKHVDVFIKACTLLAEKSKDITVSIYGEGDKEYTEFLKREAESLSKSGRITFHGSVPNVDTPRIYNEYAVVVNLTASGNYDKTVLEAMACQTISVASSDAFRDVLGEEYRFSKNDPDDLARLIQKVFSLPQEEYDKEAKRVREYTVAQHSLKKLTGKISEYLKNE